MSPLPEDLIESEILTRMPVKSLFRSKCVSKRYRDLISSPKFISLHLNKARESGNNRLLIRHYGEDDLFLYDLASPGPSAVKLTSMLTLFGYDMMGSCNGLHCFAKNNNTFVEFVVSNPITGSYKEISYCFLDFPKEKGHCFALSGFGYDDVNDDYKIVMVVPSCSLEHNYQEIHVYSLRDESWRDVGVHFSISRKCLAPAVVIDNHFSLLHIDIEGKLRMGCFDISSEQWSADERLIDDVSKTYGSLPEFGEFDGCLYSFVGYFIGFKPVYELWVMEEYGVQESWTKILGILDTHILTTKRRNDGRIENIRTVTPLCYVKGSRNKILLWDWWKSELILYDLISKTTNKTAISGVTGSWSGQPAPSQAYLCGESLVSVPGGKQFARTDQIISTEDSKEQVIASDGVR